MEWKAGAAAAGQHAAQTAADPPPQCPRPPTANEAREFNLSSRGFEGGGLEEISFRLLGFPSTKLACEVVVCPG